MGFCCSKFKKFKKFKKSNESNNGYQPLNTDIEPIEIYISPDGYNIPSEYEIYTYEY